MRTFFRLRMSLETSFYCYGHKNVLCKHLTTLEFTTDDFLTLKGDCIIGIRSNMSLFSLPEKMKQFIRNDNTKIIVRMEVDDLVEEVIGYGNSKLELSDTHAMIIRKSSYTCSRTLMVGANKAAIDISREIVQKMKNPDSKMRVTIQVFPVDNRRSIHA